MLLKYVVDTFWDQLAPFEHMTSIQALKDEPVSFFYPTSTLEKFPYSILCFNNVYVSSVHRKFGTKEQH